MSRSSRNKTKIDYAGFQEDDEDDFSDRPTKRKKRQSDPAKKTKQAERSSKRKSTVEIFPSEVQSNAKRSRLSRDERQYDQDLNKALTLSMDPEPKSIMPDNNSASNDRDVSVGASDGTNQQSDDESYSECTEYKEGDSEDTEDDYANEKDKSSKSKTGKSKSQKVSNYAVKGYGKSNKKKTTTDVSPKLDALHSTTKTGLDIAVPKNSHSSEKVLDGITSIKESGSRLDAIKLSKGSGVGLGGVNLPNGITSPSMRVGLSRNIRVKPLHQNVRTVS